MTVVSGTKGRQCLVHANRATVTGRVPSPRRELAHRVQPVRLIDDGDSAVVLDVRVTSMLTCDPPQDPSATIGVGLVVQAMTAALIAIASARASFLTAILASGRSYLSQGNFASGGLA